MATSGGFWFPGEAMPAAERARRDEQWNAAQVYTGPLADKESVARTQAIINEYAEQGRIVGYATQDMAGVYASVGMYRVELLLCEADVEDDEE